MSLYLSILFIIHALHICCDSLCNVVQHNTCDNICNDLDNCFNIALEQRTYYTLTNETNYTYIVSYNTALSADNCLNDIFSSVIWIELWPSNCCINQMNSDATNENNMYGWKFETNLDSIHEHRFTVTLQGDMSLISVGSYWIYNNVSDTNCIHKSQITVPNICYNMNHKNNNNNIHNNIDAVTVKSELKCDTLTDMIINGHNMTYCITIISVVFVAFMLLIIVIICKHHKLNKLQQQIEDYYSDFRSKKNSTMKSTHYPSIAGSDNINVTVNNNNSAPTHNIYNRYSVTMNSNPITFDIKSVASNHKNNEKQNIISKNSGNSNEELSVSYSDDKQHEMNEMEFLKAENKDIKSYSHELTTMTNDQHKFGINHNLRYNNVPSFEHESNNTIRHKAFL